jgi:hypothetical protein
MCQLNVRINWDAPSEVTVRFNEKLEPAFSSVVVRDAEGKQVDKGDGTQPNRARRTHGASERRQACGTQAQASFMEESAAKSSRPPQAVQASAQQIVDAGARARNERSAPDVRTGVARKLRSDLPPVGSTAREMINIDRKRRGLAPYGDDE